MFSYLAFIADSHSYLDLCRSGIDDMVEHMWPFMALHGHRMVEKNMSRYGGSLQMLQYYESSYGLSVIYSIQFLFPENWM